VLADVGDEGGGLLPRHLVRGDVDALAEELLGQLEHARGEGGDVRHGHHLQAAVVGQAHGQQAGVQPVGEERAGEVLHEEDGGDDGPVQVAALQVALHLELAVEVGDAGVLVGAGHRGVEEVAHVGELRGVDEVAAVAHLGAGAPLGGRGHGVDGLGAAHGLHERVHVIEVPDDELGAALLELQRGRGTRVAGEGEDVVPSLEEEAGQGASLLSGGTRDQDLSGWNMRDLRATRLPPKVGICRVRGQHAREGRLLPAPSPRSPRGERTGSQGASWLLLS
jgi:hypothetical protein